MAGPWEDYQQQAPAAGGPWADYAPSTVFPGRRQAQDIADAVIAGFQSSSLGLALRGEMPSMQLGEDAPWYQRLGAGAAGIVGDVPAMVAGAAAASRAGPAGQVIGAFAAPMALREALIEAYGHSNAASWAGVWDITKAALAGGAKGATVGVATVAAGAGAGALVAKLAPGASALARGSAVFGSELAALTATSAAVEGHMPTWQDFMDNALLLGGVKGAVKVAQGLRATYAATGKAPNQVRADAERNLELKKQLQEGKFEDVPDAYKVLALEEKVKAALDKDNRPEVAAALKAELAGNKDHPLNGDLVRYEYLTSEEAVKGVIKAVAETYKDDIEVARRGKVPIKESIIDGQKMLEEGTLKRHQVGKADSPGESAARAMLTRDAAVRAKRVAELLEQTPREEWTTRMRLELHAAMEQVSLFYGEFAGGVAESARTVRLMREIKRNPSILGDAETLLKLYERQGKSTGDLAAMVRAFNDPAALAEFIKDAHKATTMEKVIEAWKAGLISGYHTTGANVLGNVGKWAFEIGDASVAATLTAAQRALQGNPMTWHQFKARAFSPIIGVQLGWLDALVAAKEVWKLKGEHVEKADVYRTAIEGKTGEIVRIPFRILQVQDVLFRTTAERAKAYELAVDRAVKEGWDLRTTEGLARVEQLTNKPQLGLTAENAQKVTQAIQQAGAEAVFAQRLGPRLELAQRAMQGSAWNFVIPFLRTPANLVSWAVQHTPGLNLLSGRWREDFAAGGERRNMALARVAGGTALAITAYQFAEDGLITGGGLFDPEQRRTKMAAGWQPYSLKIGNEYWSYQRIEPIAKVIGIVADLIELRNRSESEEDKAKIAAMIVLMFGNATVSTTYLSGLANTMQAITDPARFGPTMIEQYASSLVPKIVGQTAASLDPHKREVDGAMDAIQAQLPWLREKLLPKRDVWGDPVENRKLWEIMPIQVTKQAEEKVKSEAMRLQVAIADAPKFAYEAGKFLPAKEKRIELTPEQRDIFRQVQGKESMAILGPIVASPWWDQKPDIVKAAIFKAVIRKQREVATYAALPPDSAERVQKRTEILNKIMQEFEATGQ